MQNCKRRSFLAATIISGLILGLIVIEVCLRIIDYSSPEFFVPNETLGYSYIPNANGTYRKEGRSLVQINSDGFRDIDHQVVKPDGVFRIAVLGDSYVAALEVSPEDNFLRYFRDAASACGAFDGRPIEVLNFGVSGYSTAQELLVLREKVWKYSPDLIVLLVTTRNDIADNSPSFKRLPVPSFAYNDGELTLDDSFRSTKKFIFQDSVVGRSGHWLKIHLRVVQAIGEISLSLKQRYSEWKLQHRAGKSDSNSTTDKVPATELDIENEIYRPPATIEWINAWKVTEGLIGRINTEVKGKGAKFLVVTASNGIQVVPSVEQRIDFSHLVGVDDLYYSDRRIADFCSSRGIPVITLAPILANYASRENEYVHGFDGNLGDGHWNQTGHRVAGGEIGKSVCQGVLQ